MAKMLKAERLAASHRKYALTIVESEARAYALEAERSIVPAESDNVTPMSGVTFTPGTLVRTRLSMFGASAGQLQDWLWAHGHVGDALATIARKAKFYAVAQACEPPLDLMHPSTAAVQLLDALARQRTVRADLLASRLHRQKHLKRASVWPVYAVVDFALTLHARARRLPYDAVLGPPYRELMGAWEDRERFASACVAAADYHLYNNCDGTGEFENLFAFVPVEFAAIALLRGAEGMSMPEIEHPLLRAPYREYLLHCEEVSYDESADTVLAKALDRLAAERLLPAGLDVGEL
jgi:hypothetical protein